MKQQPDNLFRDKLENFQLNAPANAWSKIETGLDKSSKKGFWLKIAAGFIVFVVAGFLLWSVQSDVGDTLASESTLTQPESLAIVSTPDKESAPEIPKVTMSDEKQEKQKKAKPTATVIAPHQPDNTLLVKITTPSEDGNTIIADIPTVIPADVVADVSALEKEINTNESQPSVYLVYTADQVNEKYLRQPSTIDATSDDKKTSRIQMLMSVANNLKNGDGGLTDLRQMKDEIFALNFLDEKKQQSKKN